MMKKIFFLSLIFSLSSIIPLMAENKLSDSSTQIVESNSRKFSKTDLLERREQRRSIVDNLTDEIKLNYILLFPRFVLSSPNGERNVASYFVFMVCRLGQPSYQTLDSLCKTLRSNCGLKR